MRRMAAHKAGPRLHSSEEDGANAIKIPAIKRPEVVLNVTAWPAASLPSGRADLPPARTASSDTLWQRLRGRWSQLWRSTLPHLLRQQTSHGSQEVCGAQELAPSPSTPFPGDADHTSSSAGEEAAAVTRRAQAVRRWQWAARAVMSSRAMACDMDLLTDRLAPAADRLHALVDLEVRLTAYAPPQRKRLAMALLKRREHKFSSFKDHAINELFITGERIFEFFTPSEMGRHRVYFTLAFLCIMVAIYCFMAGQYPVYKALTQPASLACMQQQRQNGTLPYGPAQMLRWITPKQSQWCFGGKLGAFDAEFLIGWGARWGPDMAKAPQRWITSVFLHQNFMHLLSNCLLFVGLTYMMEAKYGTWRIVLLWVLSAIGGNLFSAVFENFCVAVVGASGGIFGIFGLFIADMVMNFETLERPLMRSFIILAFFIFFVVTIATTPTGTSHLSHVGGFVCGLFPSFLFLPNLHSEWWEAWLPIIGGLVAVVVYVSLPVYFYVSKLPNHSHCW